MTAALPKKVPFRREHTGDAGQDRAQRMAQAVGTAHEQTKSVVAALVNQVAASLAADTTIASGAYATIASATITTTLASGHLVVTATASGQKTTASGSNYLEVVVDGVVIKGAYTSTAITLPAWNLAIVAYASVTRGAHLVELKWRTDVSSSRINALSVVEEHAQLLVQEAA